MLVILLSGCSAEKKAQRAAAKEETRRKAHIELLKETRAKYPCDTAKTTVVTKTELKYLPGNTAYRNDTAFVTDTVIQERHTHTINTIIDSAYTEQLINENASLKYGGQMLREQFNDILEKYTKEKKLKEAEKERGDDWRFRFWLVIGVIVFFTLGLGLLAYLKK